MGSVTASTDGVGTAGVVSVNAVPAPVPGPRPRMGVRRVLAVLGPGLITGDADPSGIATYSATGAQFGYSQLWTALWMLPLLTALGEASGRIGYATGQGLGAAMRRRYALRVVRGVLLLV